MTSTYSLMKNILNIDEDISQSYKQIRFKQDSLEEKYRMSLNDKIEKIMLIPSLIIFFFHVINVFNIVVMLGKESLLGFTVIFCVFDLLMLIFFIFTKLKKCNNRKLIDKLVIILILRSAFLLFEYLLNFLFCYLSPNENRNYFYIKIIFNIVLVKNFFYLFLLPNNIFIAVALHFISLCIMLIYSFISDLRNPNTINILNNNSNSENNTVLRNITGENENNYLINYDFEIYFKNSLNFIDILFETAIFLGTYFLKRYINIQFRISFLEKFKFKHFYKYCDELICGLNGYHISFVNHNIAYVSNNFQNFINKNYMNFYIINRNSYINGIEKFNNQDSNEKFKLHNLNNDKLKMENKCNFNEYLNDNNLKTIQTNNNNEIKINSKKDTKRDWNNSTLNIKYTRNSNNLNNITNIDENIHFLVFEFLRNFKFSQDENINLLDKINNLYQNDEKEKLNDTTKNHNNNNTDSYFKLDKNAKKSLTNNSESKTKKNKNLIKCSLSQISKNSKNHIETNIHSVFKDLYNDTNKNLISLPKLEFSSQFLLHSNNDSNLSLNNKKTIQNKTLNLKETLNYSSLENNLNKQEINDQIISKEEDFFAFRKNEFFIEENKLKDKNINLENNNKIDFLNKNQKIENGDFLENFQFDKNLINKNYYKVNFQKINKNNLRNIKDTYIVGENKKDLAENFSNAIEIISEDHILSNIPLPQNDMQKDFSNENESDYQIENSLKNIKFSEKNKSGQKSIVFIDFEKESSMYNLETIKNNFTQEKLIGKTHVNDSLNSSFNSNNKKYLKDIFQIKKRKYIKFKKLGEFFFEVREKRKFFLVYYRKINEVLDIYFYDYTKIKQAEKISSENKIKHKILSKIAHEFKTPLNSILDLLNNLKSASKNYLFKKDLNIIQALTNYTIYLISDVIHYASSDDILPYKKIKNLLNQNYKDSNKNTKLKLENTYKLNDLNKNFSNSQKDNNIEIKNKLNIFFQIVDIRNCLFFCFDILNALLSCHENKKDFITTELYIEDKLNLFIVQTDEIRLNQIIINFISNSVKFTKNGKIALIAKFLKTKNQPESRNNENYYLKISVVDSGMGISVEDQNKLFNEEIKLDTKHDFNQQGSGLGLSICASMIDILNIKIRFASKENVGSVFSILLPVKKTPCEEDNIDHLRNKNNISHNINKNININNFPLIKEEDRNILSTTKIEYDTKRNILNNNEGKFEKSIDFIKTEISESDLSIFNVDRFIKNYNKNKKYKTDDLREYSYKSNGSKCYRDNNIQQQLINNPLKNFNDNLNHNSHTKSQNLKDFSNTSNKNEDNLEKKFHFYSSKTINTYDNYILERKKSNINIKNNLPKSNNLKKLNEITNNPRLTYLKNNVFSFQDSSIKINNDGIRHKSNFNHKDSDNQILINLKTFTDRKFNNLPINENNIYEDNYFHKMFNRRCKSNNFLDFKNRRSLNKIKNDQCNLNYFIIISYFFNSRI